jgi:hypothetical protein
MVEIRQVRLNFIICFPFWVIHITARDGPRQQFPARAVQARGMTDKQEVRRPHSEALHEVHCGEDVG